jgi:hypothetical protein
LLVSQRNPLPLELGTAMSAKVGGGSVLQNKKDSLSDLSRQVAYLDDKQLSLIYRVGIPTSK